MFSIAATRSGRFERRTAKCLSTWPRDDLREVALADLGCAVLGVVAVRHEPAVADPVNEPGRDRYPGLTVVGACVPRPGESEEVAGVPVYGGLDDITAAFQAFSADTVAGRGPINGGFRRAMCRRYLTP